MTSERLREREAHRCVCFHACMLVLADFARYYQSWIDSSVGFRNADPSATARYHANRTQFVLSKDKALMAFAQLGCLKLNVKRGVIALISSSRMYILAEATKSLSLASDTSDAEGKDEIWFGTASLPRSQSVSESALMPGEYTARDRDGTVFTATARVIDDITKDPLYADRDYAGNGVMFYAGVPLVTDSGFPIGVYSMSDDKPRNGLSTEELRFLCDMAITVVRHLDTVRNEAARFRGETMIFGLGRFMRGFSSVEGSIPRASRLNEDATDITQEPIIDSRSPATSSVIHKFKGISVAPADPSLFRPILTSDVSPTQRRDSTEARESLSLGEAVEQMPSQAFIPRFNRKQGSTGKQESLNKIFSRAANILRECASADGVVFFDAVSTNFAKRSSVTEFQSFNRNDIPASKPKTSLHADGTDTDTHEQGSSTPVGISSDTDDTRSMDEAEILCQLLGYSMKVEETPVKNFQNTEGMSIHERTIRRLIKKYPEGKVFHFNTDQSHSSSDLDLSTGTASDAGPRMVETAKKHTRHEDAARALKRTLPSAQSVIWLPIWDFTKQRWSAGALLWSRKPEQLAVAQDNFIYLKAFANSIMIEIARLDAALSDEAKATFIANISHELRSPLHGIIGNCEILQDTNLDNFQTSLVAAIELCGRTLNDTFDHVLDYAKINQLSKRSQPAKEAGRQPSFNTSSFNPKKRGREVLECDFDLANLVEEVVETVYVSRSFRPNLELLRKAHSSTSDRNKVEPTDFDSKSVQVTFCCEHRNDWNVRAEAGAIQRVVINLFSNALKYTNAGLVEVSLAALPTSTGSSKSQEQASGGTEQTLDVVLTVRDTGKGMSEDFVRNYAFTPFRQESSFTEGTGLGLSIVQQLVDSMGGKIELKSKLNVGTEIKVFLSLQQPQTDETAEAEAKCIRELSKRTQGLPICMISQPGHENKHERTKRQSVEKALVHTVETWFGMQVTKASSPCGVKAGIFLYLTTPSPATLLRDCTNGGLPMNCAVIVLTANVPQVAELRSQCLDQFTLAAIWLEVISHPIGPRKLANVLSNCLERRNTVEHTNTSRLPKGIGGGVQNPLKAGRKRARNSKSLTPPDPLDPTPATTTIAEPPKQQTISLMSLDSSRSTTKSQTTDPQINILPTSQTFNRVSMQVSGTDTTSSFVTDVPDERKRVLLVEDNPINLNILKVAMTQAKISFGTASNGSDAVETFKNNSLGVDAHGNASETSFTHVLMDISMPVMDGIEATRLIREFERDTTSRQRRKSVAVRSEDNPLGGLNMEATQHVGTHAPEEGDANVTSSSAPSDYLTRPKLIQSHSQPPRKRPAMIIAISGVASDQAQRDMFNAGADMFMAKPVKPKELARLIRGEPVISP